jgi:hypothetical protein
MEAGILPPAGIGRLKMRFWLDFDGNEAQDVMDRWEDYA